MGFTWHSLGRWTFRRTLSPEKSLEPLRHMPAGHATTARTCDCPDSRNHHEPSSRLTLDDETLLPTSSHTDELRKQSPAEPFRVQTHGVEETEALLRGESSNTLIALHQRQKDAERHLRSEGSEADSYFWTRTVPFAWGRRREENTASQQQQRWRRRHDHGSHRHYYGQPYKDANPEEEFDEAKEVNHRHWEDLQALDEDVGRTNTGRRSETQRKSLTIASEVGIEKVPRLPSLYFPEFGGMAEEAGIPSTPEESGIPTPGCSEDTEAQISLEGNLMSVDRLPMDCLDSLPDTCDADQEGCGQLTRDGLGIYRSMGEEFEGWQRGEEKECPQGASHDTPRPVTGLGWYDDKKGLTYPTIDRFDPVPNECYSDETTKATMVKRRNFPVRKDSLKCSSQSPSFSETSALVEIGESPTQGQSTTKSSPSMSTIIDNTNTFLQSNTEEDDCWPGTKPERRRSFSRDQIEYTSRPPYSDDNDPISPGSSKFSPTSSGEKEIDDLLDIYATSSTPSDSYHPPNVQDTDLPPYPPYHPSALGPLLTIAHGLSLPVATPFTVLQDHLARNANILRYLVLQCIPAPSVNPIEHTTDLVEPILPPPLPTHPAFVQNYPQHPRRREYTRLLQAIRSVRWSAEAINDMLAVVDFYPLQPGLGRPSTALPMFRKLRAADAERKGYLTSAQLHRLHCNGMSLLDVLQMNDIPKVVSRGLGGRLVEAAESGALGIARECNLIDEKGALLELLADPDDLVPKKLWSERSGHVGVGSGLRNCVVVDGDDDSDGQQTDDESEANDEETFVELFAQDEGDGYGAEDVPYIVSPLSPEANPGDHPWDQQEISPLTNSSRIRELETLFNEVRALSSTRNGRPDHFQECVDGGVLVDEEAVESSEPQRFFHEVGAASMLADSNVLGSPTVRESMESRFENARLAPGDRRSWGMDLGDMLDD